jgi:multiple sugar transport system substrate-binding protein
MIAKIKQNWAFIFLVLIVFIYMPLYFFLFSNHSHKVTEIYFADRITAAHRILINKYNKMNEGKVKVIPIDFANYDFSTNERKEILARSLRGKGEGIDLFAVDLIWMQRFAKWSEPLDKYFTADEKKRILKVALQSCYYDGELVAAPLDLVQGIMYYREDLIKKTKNGDQILKLIASNNITWTDFIKLKDRLGLKNPFYIFPATDSESFICCFMEILLSIKPDYFEVNGFDFNTPEAKRALQFVYDLINKYNVSPPEITNFTEVPSFKYFIKNNGIFIRGWQSYDKDFADAPFDTVKQKCLRKTALPYFADGKPASIFGGWNLMVSKFSDKKEEVVKFVKFLLDDESQETFFKESGYYPVINSFYENPKYNAKYPGISWFKELMKSGIHRPANAEYTKYSKIMSFYFTLALKNEMSVTDALAKATSAIKTEKVVTKEY